MKKTITRAILGAALLLGVAGLAYAAGAKSKKESMTIPAGEIHWEEYAPGVPLQVAMLWGDRKKGGDYGMLLKFPAGFEAGMHSHTLDYTGVSIKGTWVHTVEGDTAPKDLPPGSFVSQTGKQNHNDQCKGKEDCIVFIHQVGKGDFIPAKPAADAKAPAGAAKAPADAKAPAAPADAKAPAAPAKK
jgi:hypothetical protein